jgi:hypothetical protein
MQRGLAGLAHKPQILAETDRHIGRTGWIVDCLATDRKLKQVEPAPSIFEQFDYIRNAKLAKLTGSRQFVAAPRLFIAAIPAGIEAMALGIPAVAQKACGWLETIEPRRIGLSSRGRGVGFTTPVEQTRDVSSWQSRLSGRSLWIPTELLAAIREEAHRLSSNAVGRRLPFGASESDA